MQFFKQILSLLSGKRPSEGTVEPAAAGADDMLARFEEFLSKRMGEFRPQVSDAFATLFKSDLSDDITGLHIEVFSDDPGFSFRLFAKDAANIAVDDPEPIQTMNATIAALWPIITEEEQDGYMVWEDDPEWGRQVALEQPLDDIDIAKIVTPWFAQIISENRGRFDRPVTLAVHDLTAAEAL